MYHWNDERNDANREKHGIAFEDAVLAFSDPRRIILRDEKHSLRETRWFCIGRVKGRVLTVRFTYRDTTIRIFGAAEWRKWRKFYEETHRNR